MGFHPELHRRRSIRLPGYDYSQSGAYFVTLVTWGREPLLGEIHDAEMRLSPAGEACAEEWVRSAELRQEITLDAWVVMPNHLHGIIFIENGAVGASGARPDLLTGTRSRSLSACVAGFKSAATRRINELRGMPGVPVWQRNYYEHIIRNDQALAQIREYIANNPASWLEDLENPTRNQR